MFRLKYRTKVVKTNKNLSEHYQNLKKMNVLLIVPFKKLISLFANINKYYVKLKIPFK